LKTYELLEVSKRVPHELGYVRIRIDEVDKRIDLKRLGQRLADTYCLLLERGDLQIMLNGALLKPRSLGEIVRKDFRVRAASTIITGWVGTVDPAKRTEDFVAGLRCYRLGRLVKDGEFFGHPTPAQEPGMAQLIGEVEVPRVPLTINKSDFDRDSDAWVDIERRLHRLLKPLVRELSRQTESPPPPSAIQDLHRGIRAAAAGQVFLSPEAAAQLVRQMKAPESPEPLTPREVEVLRLMALGRANKQIARQLGVREETVKTHVRKILSKLQAASRTQAALHAIRTGLVSSTKQPT
jgi:DNA-binding CsgD family transcriptional regulator